MPSVVALRPERPAARLTRRLALPPSPPFSSPCVVGQSLAFGTASDGSRWVARCVGFYGVTATPAWHRISIINVRKEIDALGADVPDAARPVPIQRFKDSVNRLVTGLLSAALALHALHIIDQRASGKSLSVTHPPWRRSPSRRISRADG